jgi:hypothetical protein
MSKNVKRYTATDGELVLTLEPTEEGGYTVTSPFVPGLVTEADTGRSIRDGERCSHDPESGQGEVNSSLDGL